jgi:hypothetical protein
MRSRAQRLAQEALSMDPTNSKASEVMKQMEDGDEDKAGSLFGRFRGKS